MAEGIKIEIFKLKNADELTRSLADPESRIETGSGAAMTAALAMALLERAAALTVKALPGNERADYIFRNAEILRTYMVHLIDEDVKSRGPLRRALQEGDARNIEAARQPAVAIPGRLETSQEEMFIKIRNMTDLVLESYGCSYYKDGVLTSSDLITFTAKASIGSVTCTW